MRPSDSCRRSGCSGSTARRSTLRCPSASRASCAGSGRRGDRAEGAGDVALHCSPARLRASPAKVILDVHGDWRTSTRLYGSSIRRLLAPARRPLAALALRRADAVRTISAYTTGLVREARSRAGRRVPGLHGPRALPRRRPRPLPDSPVALFVGVLERYKNVDGLADAWRLVAREIPEARLRHRRQGHADRSDRASRRGAARAGEMATASWTQRPWLRRWTRRASLVLPSRSEGLGRVVIEALCRARPWSARAWAGSPI